MRVYTDSPDYATRLLPTLTGWCPAATDDEPAIGVLASRCFPTGLVHTAEVRRTGPWSALLIVESPPASQFDLLVTLGREGITLPDGTLCVAGGGSGLHGLRGRPWVAEAGNIHLSLWLAPPEDVIPSATRFLAMAAVSVVETVDSLPNLRNRAGIRWVNDVFVDGGKVCGILTHVPTASGAGVQAAVVGIGLNVEVAPRIEPTPFVPRAHALRRLSQDPTVQLGAVFPTLLNTLADNYGRLCDGRYGEILDAYRRRSLVLGRRVALYHEGGPPHTLLAEGRVERLGDELELYLEGVPQPFTIGRAVVQPE